MRCAPARALSSSVSTPSPTSLGSCFSITFTIGGVLLPPGSHGVLRSAYAERYAAFFMPSSNPQTFGNCSESVEGHHCGDKVSVHAGNEELPICAKSADVQIRICVGVFEGQQSPNLEAHIGCMHCLHEFVNFLNRVERLALKPRRLAQLFHPSGPRSKSWVVKLPASSAVPSRRKPRAS